MIHSRSSTSSLDRRGRSPTDEEVLLPSSPTDPSPSSSQSTSTLRQPSTHQEVDESITSPGRLPVDVLERVLVHCEPGALAVSLRASHSVLELGTGLLYRDIHLSSLEALELLLSARRPHHQLDRTVTVHLDVDVVRAEDRPLLDLDQPGGRLRAARELVITVIGPGHDPAHFVPFNICLGDVLRHFDPVSTVINASTPDAFLFLGVGPALDISWTRLRSLKLSSVAMSMAEPLATNLLRLAWVDRGPGSDALEVSFDVRNGSLRQARTFATDYVACLLNDILGYDYREDDNDAFFDLSTGLVFSPVVSRVVVQVAAAEDARDVWVELERAEAAVGREVCGICSSRLVFETSDGGLRKAFVRAPGSAVTEYRFTDLPD